MTSITLNARSGRSGGMAATVSGSRQTQLNRRLGYCLVAFVALAPVPLGGARPLFWAISGAVIGLAAIIYGISLWRKGETLRVGLMSLSPIITLWMLLLAFLVLQITPISPTFGLVQFEGFNGVAVSSNTLSMAPGETVLMLLRMAGYGCFFFLAVQAASNRDRAMQMARWVCYIIAAHALYGLVALTQLGDPLLFVAKWAYFGSATGTFVNRNSYATFLAVGLVLSVGLSMRTLLQVRPAHLAKGQRKPFHLAVPLLVAALMILAALLASESRMGLFAGLLGSATLVCVGLIKGRAGARARLLPAILLVIAVLGIGLLFFSGGTLERLGSVERDGDVRLQLYGQVWEMIQQRWLSGFGGGGFELAYNLFHRAPVSPDRVWDKAHSTYLELWSELGVFAGSLPMLIFVILGIAAVRFVVARQADWWLPLIAICTIVVIAVHSLVDFSMEISGNVYLVLFVLALGTAQRSSPSARKNGQAPQA